MKDVIKSTVVNKAKEAASELFNFPQIDTDLEVWFIFEGKEYEVEQFSISFGQGVDFKGQPQDEIRGGRILLTLSQAVPENIYQWAMTSRMRDGKVEYRSKTASSPLKVEFVNGYCVNFRRVIRVDGGFQTTLDISSEEITINGISMDNHWVKS